MTEAEFQISEMSSFVAGTLVHTKEGLKPIEQIKVGDWVLSKPEDRQGETTYKRVINTFEYEDKEVFSVDFTVEDRICTFIVTGNHPFWVEDKGWTRADYLDSGYLEVIDGSICNVFNVSPVIATEYENIGWIQGGFGLYDRDDPYGRFIDLNNYTIAIDYDSNNQAPHEKFWPYSENLLKRRVYNLEVEDYHTYFVGDMGVWVHDVTA